MRILINLGAALLLSAPGLAVAQEVEYVTRTRVGHAIPFGSAPLIVRSQPVDRTGDAHRTDSRQRHAIPFDSRPLELRLPRGYIVVNNSAHTVQKASEEASRSRQTSGVRTIGPGAREKREGATDTPARSETSDREASRNASQTRETRAERPAPSRHLLRVAAIMRTELDCRAE